MHSLLLILPLVAAQSDASIDDASEPKVLEGHSAHGEAFNEGPRQAAYLMPNPGSVHFPVTSDHADVPAMFDQGVGHLHGFWFFEAERSFRQVAAWDPDCAMAYWGMALSNPYNDERAAAFAREAWLRRENASEHEQMYIDAWARFYQADYEEVVEEEPLDLPVSETDGVSSVEAGATDAPAEGHGSGCGEGNGKGEGPGGGDGEGARSAGDGADKTDAKEEKEEEEKKEKFDPEAVKKRAKELIVDIEALIRAYPDDIEAKAQLVVTSWALNYRGVEISSRQALQSVLDEIFRVEPNHPVHHYRIHLWDKEETSEYVVNSAVSSGPSWPTIAHMWHMGGHIFENLGRHRDAAWQQEASARIDHEYMMRDYVLPDQIHNFAHNNEWLVRSLGHCGRVREALDLARNMIELPRHPDWNMPDDGGTSSFWGRRRLFGTLELFELWEEMIALSESNYLEPTDNREENAYRAFLIGMAHTFLGHEESRLDQIVRLRELLAEEKHARVESLEAAEEEALAEDKKRGEVKDAIAGAMDEHARPLDDLRGKIATLEALAAVRAGEEVEEALEELLDNRYNKATLARFYAEAGLNEKGEELAREAAEDKLGQAQPHANLAYVLDQVGKREEALDVFRELREISAEFDLEMPAFGRLEALAAAEGLPKDWRVELVIPDDVGDRPDLTTLGPKRWTAPPAPDWSCEDSLGKTHTLADSTGKPRILILFLGFGCAHCVEQLHAFGPAAEDFAAAGIDIITIGDDAAEELNKYDPGQFPFPVLADSEYEVFKSYRCFDDFENVPLHGTFLIDGDNKMRWQDVSYEPFTDTVFLLAESKRLLGLPTP